MFYVANARNIIRNIYSVKEDYSVINMYFQPFWIQWKKVKAGFVIIKPS